MGFLGEGPLVHRTPLWPSGCLLPETEGPESQVDIPGILRTACAFGGGLLPAAPWFPRRGLPSSVVAPATSTHVLRGPLGHLASVPTPPWLRPGQAGPENPGGPHLSLLPSGGLLRPLWVLRGQAGRSPAVLRVGRGREQSRGPAHWSGKEGWDRPVAGALGVSADVAQTPGWPGDGQRVRRWVSEEAGSFPQRQGHRAGGWCSHVVWNPCSLLPARGGSLQGRQGTRGNP